ncbi:MAG: hypothetical protein JXR96_19130 [Deltaproteobacteria bacterium]|nr:hypothetical protein [Deltaproteobacteria bacterium]
MLGLVVTVFAVAILGLFSSLFALVVTRVPVLRTPVEHLPAIAGELGALEGRRLVDAGCADARTLVQLCRLTGAQGVGYELNGPVALVAALRLLLTSGTGRTRVRWADYRRSDFEDVDAVYCFLMPSAMRTLADKCSEEMRVGGLLVSFMWPVPDREPLRTVQLGPRADPLFVYAVESLRSEQAERTGSSVSP